MCLLLKHGFEDFFLSSERGFRVSTITKNGIDPKTNLASLPWISKVISIGTKSRNVEFLNYLWQYTLYWQTQKSHCWHKRAPKPNCTLTALSVNSSNSKSFVQSTAIYAVSPLKHSKTWGLLNFCVWANFSRLFVDDYTMLLVDCQVYITSAGPV